jgi:AIPR protein/abortive infection phage resistance-like protein
MTDAPLDAFARDLADDIDEAVRTDTAEPYSETQFTRLMLEELAERNVFENPIFLSQGGEGRFGRTQYKITGFEFSDDDERLLLITTIYTGECPPKVVARDVLLTAVERAARFYEASCKGLHTRIEPANTDASDLARKIYESQGDIRVLRIVVLSDGVLGALSRELPMGSKRLVAELYGIEQLHRMLGDGESRADILVDVAEALGAPLPCLPVGNTGAGFDTYLTAIPASLLAHTYERYGTRLLELNVRAFLGVRGRQSVNAGLRRTLLSEPTRFLAYNNGIVATVDEIQTKATATGGIGIATLSGLQIVNGGQTTASIHRARKQDTADLTAVLVPAKIIKVGGEKLEEMVSAISKSANSQNTVQPADFSANDPFHVTVEQLANNTWIPGAAGRWFYERARGSYGAAETKASYSKPQQRKFRAETPKQRRFSKTDLAKTLNAWSGLPHLVSYGNQKNFQHFMQQLKQDHPQGFVPDAVWYRAFVAKLILFRSIQRVVKTEKFPAYQANIGAYTASLLAYRCGSALKYEDIWNRQGASPELEAMILDWARAVDAALRQTAGMKMPTEWAKRAECWEEVRNAPVKIPAGAIPELRA